MAKHGAKDGFKVALISEVFFGNDGERRLRTRLAEAKARGAELACLPEIPLDPWAPATKTARDEDAEPPLGPRHRMMARAAAEREIALVGGAIVRDPASGLRHNTALVFDARGALVSQYAKCHIPAEPGFHESDHYEPGTEMSRPIEGFPLAFGVQICSDINRPEGCHVLGALGAHLVLAPRATEQRTYARWKVVFQANALTSCMYVLSVNRPKPEQGVLLGGPSLAIDPDGKVLAETTDPICVVELARRVVEKARAKYPGYLAQRAGLYAKAWASVPDVAPRPKFD